jgi:PAS domain S-box-containing protein
MKSMTKVAGALAILVGGLAIAGWVSDTAVLRSILPGWVSMKPNTAVAFMLMGSAMLLTSGQPASPSAQPSELGSRIARFCALLAGLIGLLTLCEYLFGWKLGIDLWLFREPAGTVGTSHPGRMAPDAALCFLLLALGWLAGTSRRVKRASIFLVIAGSLVTTLALVELVSYFMPMLRSYGWGGLTMMALPTTVLFATLGLAFVLGTWREALSPRLAEFSNHLWWLAGCFAALAISFALYVRSEKEINRAHELRYQSLLLGDALRQSGDDLTRMARTYVVTGDPIYKKSFQDILDFREGRKPWPEQYWRPYWDLVLGSGPVAPGDHEAIPLLELMRQAGFAEGEFRLLAEAKANSDALTVPEFEAMKLVESTGPGAEANRARARMMLFDAHYHLAKAGVMKPIHAFLDQVDKRTLAGVRSAENSATIFRYLLLAFGLGLVFVLWRTFNALGNILGGPVDKVYSAIARIGGGDFSTAIQVKPGRANSVLGWLAATQDKLNDSERERWQAEAALRESEDTYRSLFDHMLNGLAQCRMEFVEDRPMDFLYLKVNASFETLTGLRDVEGRWISEVIPGIREADPGPFEAYGRVAKGGPPEHFETYVEALGMWFSISVYSPRMDHFVAVFDVITERKQAEEALRSSEQLYRSIGESMDYGVWVCAPDGRNTYASESFLRLVGLTQEQCSSFGWGEVLHPDDAERTIAAWKECVRTGKDWEIEHRFRGVDGAWHPVLARGVAVRNEQGRITSWAGINLDISRIKQAEEEVRQLNIELEQRVIERTAQLEAANKELEAFSYSVSHDLRAPLRHMTGFVELLGKKEADRLDAKSQHYLKVVSDSAQKMGQLIDDLLSFSRMGRTELMKRRVDLKQLSEEVIEEVSKDLPEGRIIQWRIGDLPVVTGDLAMLRLALVNLVSNAVKYTKYAEEPRIELAALAADPDWTTIYIKDNGVGFNMKYVDKLFGLFQRLHSSEDFEGTGVGLANVRRIISRHGGQTWAEGESNKGATFYFTLPQDKEI